ncbi:MAG: elongation factor P [Bdellovibrionota bacterium]
MKAKDIRKGKVILFKDAPHSVMEFTHRTPGNLRAFVQAKLRNLITGQQTETRFSSTEDLTLADVYAFDATYLYKDTSGYHFMNSETYEETVINDELIADNYYYLSDGMKVSINTYNENPISITLPKTVVLTIEDTAPELRGATASNSPKPAKTNTGLTLSVPPFLKIGDKIVVDTEEAAYLSRADDK